ncbi:Gfo/Idh/MocA family protein [Brevundimonas diminuta]|uniref:Alpha-N-acetylgalactosaminidase n=1 Tax=Brevundimonas diminuta TaxID=293 RepID=A0A2X1B6I2_BREDI|nr:Gfo/Idh/MocA family oxidoreductase [Brevundimonas diminuta]SPU46424.1 Alpha-N-acetylgalactosaminidase [Brevundimonas diminuta]
MDRRAFIAASSAAVAASTLAGPALARNDRLQIGIIGTGLRAQSLMSILLKRADVDIVALCDIEPLMIARAKGMIAAAGKPAPRAYEGAPDQAYRDLLAHPGLDAVIIATPWEWHAPMAIAAMEAKIPVGCEVVAGVSLQDHWDVLEAHERTGTPYMVLENVCYRRDVLAVLNMVRAGLFGELVHLQGGYQHDLRAVKFNSGDPQKPYGGGVEFGPKGWSEARWRTWHSVNRNGELYPSHGIGPIANWIDLNRGNRMTTLTAYASKARGLHAYVVDNGGPDHPNAQVQFKLGDVVTTSIGCANGETLLLQHDTNLPRPYSLGFRVQGVKGLWMDLNKSVHIEGRSPEHQWEAQAAWFEQYDHPLWKTHADTAAGSGHGGMDFFVIHAFVEALKAKAAMPLDIYDAVSWSAITPLSEQSIAEGNRTVDFPDFTRGAWRERKPIFGFDGVY